MRSWGAIALAICGAVCTTGCGAPPVVARPAAVSVATVSPSDVATPAPVVTATPSPPPPTPSPTPACTTAGVLSTWSLQRLAAQAVVVPVDESAVGAVAPEVAAGAGGVILFGSSAPADLGASLAALMRGAPDGVAPLVMSDEEGGAIQRLPSLAGRLPSPRQMAATMSAAQIQALAVDTGRRMRAAGVTMDLAPVLDLDGGDGPNAADPDGTRSFSVDASVASADGIAFAAGLQSSGVVPVVKHFPGLGGATGNTDVVAAITQPWSVLQGAGLLPFAAAIHAGVPAVMVGNAGVPGLSALPSSLSPAVIGGVLRGRLGFGGLVMTDSLSAVSVSAAGYSVPAAATAALAAGADMVLFNGDAAAVPSLTAAVVQAIAAGVPRPRLEDAALHVLAAKHLTLC